MNTETVGKWSMVKLITAVELGLSARYRDLASINLIAKCRTEDKTLYETIEIVEQDILDNFYNEVYRDEC